MNESSKPAAAASLCVAAEVQLGRTRPVDRAQAHRARLATGVDLAALELEGPERGTGAANGDHLGVRRRVARRGHQIDAFRQDAAVLDDDRAERAAAPASHVFQGELDRSPHVLLLPGSPRSMITDQAGCCCVMQCSVPRPSTRSTA